MEHLAPWITLGTALAAFLFSHAVPARPPIRRRLTAIMGVRLYILLYSALSVVLLVWVVEASSSAPFVELWAFADWQRHVPAVAVPLALALGVAGLFTPNPLSLSTSKQPLDRSRPGVLTFTRHPVLLAMALWATAHLVPNGELAHVVLFGTFLILSIGGMFMMDRRARRNLGDREWIALRQIYPVLGWPSIDRLDARSILLGLCGALLALAFGALHGQIVGVPAFAP